MGPESFSWGLAMLRVSMMLLGLLLVAGCGDADDATDAGFTEDNITERMTAAMVTQGSLHMEMTINAGKDQITASADQIVGDDPDDYAMSLEYADSEGAFEMRLVEGIIYADMGSLSDHKFLRVDPDNPSGPMGESLAPLMDELDIPTSVRQFEEAITDVEQQGDDTTIDGVETTPYRVTIDVDRAVASGALDKDSGLRPGTRVAYTFHLDADDLLRRIEFNVGSSTSRVDLTDYGKPVDIKAPPEADVIDESELPESATV